MGKKSESKQMRYFTIDSLGDPNNMDEMCFIDSPAPEEVKIKDYKISTGEPASNFYPTNAKVYMDNTHKGKVLGDLIGNTSSFLIVHKRIKEIIEKYSKKGEVEYLPFTLYNHKKQPCSSDYFFINPLGTKDCLNIEKSGVEYFETGEVVGLDEIVIDPLKLVDAPHIFRVNEEPTTYIFSRDLLKSIADIGATNFFVNELRLESSKGQVPQEKIKLSSTMLSAAKQGNLKKVKECIVNGADINFQDADGNTALHHASSLSIFKLLIEAGADVYKKNNNKKSALDNLIQRESIDILIYLKNKGFIIPEKAFKKKAEIKKVKKIVSKKNSSDSYEFDTYAKNLLKTVIETVVKNKKSITVPVYKFKLTYRAFEELLPSGVQVCLSEGKRDLYLEIVEPDTHIPSHVDYVDEEDSILSTFLEGFEMDEEDIAWGDTFQIPTSLLRYEIIMAARQAVNELEKKKILFTSDCEICIGDNNEDEGDAEEYLSMIKKEIKTKLPKKEKKKRKNFAECCYKTKVKQEWFCEL